MKKMHEEGFIYRDIKASNFMINSKGRVTMIDLGKAKRINGERTFTICGTTHSMPP
jgi:serine/threonine protein kinase